MTDAFIEKSFKAQKSDLDSINRYTRRAFNEDELYLFSLTLCDNDIDRDFEKFSNDALNELAKLFEGKTGIFDHSMKSGDQTARIYETWVEEQVGKTTFDNEPLCCLKAKAYMVRSEKNGTLITEIDAGIKKEVSVSCSMKNAVCSVCGADRYAGGCTHTAGQVYDGKIAFTKLFGAADAYEWSFVAVPAQRDAGVTKSFGLRKDAENMDSVMKKLKNCEREITLTKGQVDNLLSMVALLEDEAKLGKQYKDDLTAQVISLCAAAMPQMDMKVFAGVAKVMTAKELSVFKNAFNDMQCVSFPETPQLAKSKNKKNNDNKQFVI